LALVLGYTGIFLRAGGPGTRAFLRSNLRHGPGFSTVVWLIVTEVAVIIASAIVDTYPEVGFATLLALLILAHLQFRAEKHWYEWTQILAAGRS
jgi:hypothetical protein